MARLSKVQLTFLKEQDIPLSRVFDATGVGPKKGHYRPVMSDLQLWVAYNVTPCKENAHTLRDRAGNCVQCNPACLGFMRRYDEPGDVYVAYSINGRLTKIGTSKNPPERVSHLNSYIYGGVSDWRLRYSRSFENAGRVEFLSQQRLDAQRVAATYEKNGRVIECQELFRCDVETAIATVKSALRG